LNCSKDFVEKKWTFPDELKGIGPYGNDAYRIFCCGDWEDVEPDDHMLNKYHSWLKGRNLEEQEEIDEKISFINVENELVWVAHTKGTTHEKEEEWWKSMRDQRIKFSKKFQSLRLEMS